MAMIEVEHCEKFCEDSKGARFDGALRSFIHPEKADL